MLWGTVARPTAAILAAVFTTCVAQGHGIPVSPDVTDPSSFTGRTLQVQSVCGWLGVQVSPMTAAVADSLGMAEPYGAILGRPEPDSPAAHAKIEAGDVITAINGSPIRAVGDFAAIISVMAPGSIVYLTTFRNGEMIEVQAVLGSTRCPAERHGTAAPADPKCRRAVTEPARRAVRVDAYVMSVADARRTCRRRHELSAISGEIY
ncbi:MAG TPA: PDZ domain-containing protein [Xanthobacteraceae bacterium]|nr:PDZ domain-containing protein [Xanthobacteraceae bacterium]